jgi:signal transduction histidine kinase/ActR/RegA family two-component response regulator
MKGVGDAITDADDAFLSIVGYTRAEFERGEMNWREMTPPELRYLDEEGIRQAMAAGSGGFTKPYQKAFIRKDGTRVPVLLCCAFIPEAAPGSWMGYAVNLAADPTARASPTDATTPFSSVDPSAFHARLITELVRERSRLLSIFQSTPALMWAVDRELRLLTANEAFHRMTQAQLGETLAVGERVLHERYPTETLTAWAAWYARALRGEAFVVRTVDQSADAPMHWDTSLAPIRDGAGAVVGVSVVCSDVSARAVAEQRLARSERALTEAQRIASVGSWEWDPATNRTTWSAEMFRIYDRDPALGAPSYEELAPYHRPEDLTTLGQLVTRALTTGEPYELDTTFVRRDGTRVFLTGRGEAIRSESDAIIGLRGAALDITKRREAELALERSERELREAQRIARVGSWDWDLRSGTVSWSPMLREMLAWPADDPPPNFEEHARFYSAESWEQLRAAVTEAITHGVPYTLDLELAPSAPLRWLVARGEPVRDELGAIVGLHGVTVDVSDRRQAEDEKRELERLLIQSQKLQAVGQLAGGIAHDFNNLLTAMLLQVTALRDEPSLAPDVAAGLLEIESEAQRAATLTRQLLMFSRRQTLDLKLLDLHQLISGFLRMLSRLIGEQVALRFEPAPGPLTLMGDTVMLEQVLMNLIVNARDAMPRGGTIIVRTRTIDVSNAVARRTLKAKAGPYLAIEVEDTGVGIPPEQRERLFEPFFTTKEAGRGTGLGLATAYGIVAQHGGWIDVESTVGVGSTFRVMLPSVHKHIASDAEQPPSALGATRPRRTGAGRVLVIEDEDALRRLLVRALELEQFTVVAAANGPDAVRVWDTESGAFDVVVSDMVLPGGASGLDLLRRFDQQRPGVGLLLMSGYSTEIVDGPKGGLELDGGGSIRMLSKPFTGHDFCQAVHSAVPMDRPVS